MSKIGYLLAAILVLGLGAYALWPAPQASARKVLGVAAPTVWRSTVDGTVTEVTAGRVAVTSGGTTWEFAADENRTGALWGALSSITVPEAKVVKDVAEAQLAGYGLAGAREAAAADGSVIIRWGASGGQAYVWNGRERTLFVVEPQVVAGLDAAAKPPYRATVLAVLPNLTRVTVDNLTLVQVDGRWLAELYRNRPPFDVRVTHLLTQLAGIAITDLAGVPVIGLPVVGTVQLPALAAFSSGPQDPSAIGAQPSRSVTVYDRGADGAVAVSGFPAQRVDATQRVALRAVFAEFRRDVLIDIGSRIRRDDLLRVDLDRAGHPWWSLQRREKPPQAGGVAWDVVWDGGRESAPDDAFERLAKLLTEVPVREPQADGKALTDLPPGGISVSFLPERPGSAQPVRVAITGGELRTATHRARLDDDGALLRGLRPERFLDDRLTRRDPSRVAKIQRRFRGESPPREEVVTRSEGGTWGRTWPQAAGGAQPPVDGAAIDRLIRVLGAARMQDVRLVAAPAAGATRDDEARALIDRAEFEIDVRFAAVPGGQASNDETDLDLSAAQDWGLAAVRTGDHWECVDKDLGLRFALDDDTVEELRRPFAPGQVFPVVASAVTAATIARVDGTTVKLARQGAVWTVDGAPADAVAVRRWFRAIGALQVSGGTALDARAPEPNPGEITASLTCDVPSVSGDPFLPTETLTLAVLRPTAAGQPVHVWSNRGNSRFPRGRTVLPGPAVAEVLAAAAAFRR